MSASEGSDQLASRAVEATPLQQQEDRILLLLTLIIGALVGLVVVAFIYVTEDLGSRLYPAGASAWRRLLIPILGSFGAGLMLYRYFPEARGSGIPQAKVAFFLRDGFISLRTVLGKFSMCSITLASGIALGREGPSVQVSCGLASVIGRRLGLSPKSVRALLPSGAAAAIAAAFNTPIAAVLFTLEEVMGDLNAPVLGSVVLSSATSWMVLHLVLGDEPLFHVPAYQLVHPIEFVFYAVLGVIGGLVSVAFVRLLLAMRRRFLAMPERTRWFQPAIGGLLVGVLGWQIPGVLGVGYGYVGQALNGKMLFTTMALLVALKLVATATCYASGNAGGIFGPSLFIGAMAGGAFGGVAHLLLPDYTGSVGAYALVGMGAAFAGIIRVPLTSVIMIFEITRDYSIIVPLMIANLISYFLSSRLQHEPIYEALQHQDGVFLPTGARAREELLTVAHAMRPPEEGVTLDDFPADESGEPFPHVHTDHPLDTALRRLAASGQPELPVINRTFPLELLGTISVQDVMDTYAIGQLPPDGTPDRRSRLPRRLYVGILGVLVALALLTAFLNYFYRAERAARADRSFRTAGELLKKERYDEAIADYRQALSVAPGRKHRLGLGLALVQAGHGGEALLYLREVLREDPADGAAQLGVARALVQQGFLDEAIRHYHQASLGNWKEDADGNRLRARLELVQLLGRAKRMREARSELLSVASELPQDAVMAKQIGRMLIEFGLPQEGAGVFREVVQRNRQDAGALEGLADALFAAGDYEAARENYRNALSLDPANEHASRRVDLTDRVIALDPTVRRLGAWQRYQRSLAILAGVHSEIARCTGAPNTAAVAKTRPRSYSDAAETNLEEAERLWDGRPTGCSLPGDDPLALVLGLIKTLHAHHHG